MSERYPGGFITKTNVDPTSSSMTAKAPGVWTLDQQLQYKQAGVWPTYTANYIEDVFSTYLHTGTGANQNIVNGIDLATKGGLVWFKPRNTGNNHNLIDSARGLNKFLITNDTAAQGTTGVGYGVSSFNSDGFSLAPPWTSSTNTTDTTYTSWTFRKQPKFFDVVTYTGDGVAGRQIAHSLGSAPGCIIVKCTNVARDWVVWHRTLSDGTYLKLNTTDAAITNTSFQVFGDASGQTSTVFTVGKTGSGVNVLTNANSAGDTYVAYLFAHNAGGFGLTGTDNVISCGSYNRTDGVKSVVNLGFEPQFIIQKTATAGSQWTMLDVMRGWTGASNSNLFANLSNAETTGNIGIMPTATGFEDYTTAGATDTIIYIAIRRGPMKVPTDGTKVFAPVARVGTGTSTTLTSVGFAPDMLFSRYVNPSQNMSMTDKLRGGLRQLQTNVTTTEVTNTQTVLGFGNLGVTFGTDDSSQFNGNGNDYIHHFFRRAPNFFDEVCYTGTGVARTVAHNLSVAPELMIVKSRSNGTSWLVYSSTLGSTYWGTLSSDPFYTPASGYWNNTNPTPSVFTVGTSDATNFSGYTYVSYLFATCAGVSKVGSYTGNGSSQTIACGFAAGARFVLIKRTDAAGDWYVWDTARGIVAGNDPHLSLNTTAAEVTSDDTIDPDSSGFIVNQVAATNVNVNAASYIFLAIA